MDKKLFKKHLISFIRYSLIAIGVFLFFIFLALFYMPKIVDVHDIRKQPELVTY
jgi:hypothetical protein